MARHSKSAVLCAKLQPIVSFLLMEEKTRIYIRDAIFMMAA